MALYDDPTKKKKSAPIDQIPNSAPDGWSGGVGRPIDSSEVGRQIGNSLNALGGMGVVASVPLKAVQAGEAAGGILSPIRAAPVLTNNIPRLGLSTPNPSAFVSGANGVKAPYSVATVDAARGVAPVAQQLPRVNAALQQGAQANYGAATARTAAGFNAAADVASGDAPKSDPQEGSPYADQMRKVGGFFGDAIKAAVGAPGYYNPATSVATALLDSGSGPKVGGILPNPTDQRLSTNTQTTPPAITAVPNAEPGEPALTTKAPERSPDQRAYDFGGGITAPAQVPGITPVKAQQVADVQPAFIANSGNDWQSRQDLANANTRASSITDKSSRRGGPSLARVAYESLLATDQARKNMDAQAQQEATRLNAGAGITNANNDLQAQKATLDANATNQNLGIQGYRAFQDAKLNDARTQDIGYGIIGKDLANQQAARLASLQQSYATEKDPAKREAIARQLQVMTGKYDKADPKDSYVVVPGGKDSNGNALPGRVFDARSGSYVAEPNDKPAPSKYPVGAVSEVGNKRARWDGNQWVPL